MTGPNDLSGAAADKRWTRQSVSPASLYDIYGLSCKQFACMPSLRTLIRYCSSFLIRILSSCNCACYYCHLALDSVYWHLHHLSPLIEIEFYHLMTTLTGPYAFKLGSFLSCDLLYPIILFVMCTA